MDAEKAKVTLATAIRGAIFVGVIMGGVYATTAGVRDRLTALETTVGNANVAVLPSQLARIEENQRSGAEWRVKTDEKLDRLLREYGDD